MSDRNQTWQEYCNVKRMNASTIVHGFKSMLSLKRAIDGDKPEETAAMRFGQEYHRLILEPEDFAKSCVVMPDYKTHPDNVSGELKPSTGNTAWAKAAKADWLASHPDADAKECPDFRKDPRNVSGKVTKSTRRSNWSDAREAEFRAANPGKYCVEQKYYDRMLRMLESLWTHERIREILTGHRKEVTVQGTICHTEFKGRLDLLGDTICDLKGTSDVRPVIFGSLACRLHYPEKMAIYRELVAQTFGGEVKPVEIIAVETDGDFDRTLSPIPEAVLDHAWGRVNGLVLRYEDALKQNKWPGVDGGCETVDFYVPNFWMPDNDEEYV